MLQYWKGYLHSLGLTESEISIYLFTLQSGPQAVLEISKKTKLSRVTVYAAIDNLTKQSLMTSVQKEKKTYYAAEPPERLVSFAEQRAKEVSLLAKEMKSRIHDLKMVETGDKPVVKLYEGKEAYLQIVQDMINSKPELMQEFGNIDEIQKKYSVEELSVNYDKLNKAVKMRRGMFVSAEKKNNQIRETVEIKYISPKEYPFPGDILIYDDKVWLSSFNDKQVSVLIESEVIKKTIQTLIDMVWKKY